MLIDTVKLTMSRKNWTDEKIIFRLKNNMSEKTYWDNIRVLRSRPSEELFGKCFELTKSDSPKNRKIGIDILAQFGLPPRPFLRQTLKLYFDLLHIEKDPEVIRSILYSIGHNNDELSKSKIEILCSFSENKHEMVKEGLVSALGFIDNLKVIEVLIKLSNDKSNDIRNWATFYIGQGERNNKNIREALWQRVNDKHQETKLEAISGLAKRKDKRVIDVIKRELSFGGYGSLLFEAIIETCDKQFLPLLRQSLKSAKGDDNINSSWLKDLQECISELTKRTNGESTNA